MYDKKIQWIYSLLETLLSIVRIFTNTTFKKTKQITKRGNRCLVMGNGPSLIDSLEKNKEKLSEMDLIAVNFMGLSPEYDIYKPSIYILCDPAFWFDNISSALEARVLEFYEAIVRKTDWPLQVYIPVQAHKEEKRKAILSQNRNISLHYYNKTKFEGYTCINHWVYNKQWGMPRTQNVLAAALMLTIYSGYKEIYLAGADTDSIRNLWVDENNRLQYNDFHYYKDSKENIARTLPSKIQDQCSSFYFVFKSYTSIEEYAGSRNVKIYNTGMKSFIDAFEKKEYI